MAGTKITLPHNFIPRHYQLPVCQALDEGKTRLVTMWHRRSGKEKTWLNLMAKKTAERVGGYFYFFPTYKQAKKAIWDGFDKDGFKFLNHFPPAYVAHRNETELKLTLLNGSIFQLVGTDNIDSIMSTNPVGCVFAEYALQDPRAWEYVRPILRENGGWAGFDFTPRGKNHGYDLYNLAMKLQAEGDPAWFCERLTVADTGAISEADIDAERREGMDEEMIQQEYYCSFAGSQVGSYFGKQMDAAEKDGRICKVPYQEEISVDTWWDLGMNDAMTLWFTQNVGREIHVIDYYENSGEGFRHYAKVMQEREYAYGEHHAPHDIAVREIGTDGLSRMESARRVGINFKAVPRVDDKQDAIDAARAIIPRCYFDREKTERGRSALVSYHKTWDDKRKCFSSSPYHDWSSNGSDGFMTFACGHKFAPPKLRNAIESRNYARAGSNDGGAQSWMGS